MFKEYKNKTRYYVYLHKLNDNTIFYVGKGSRERAYSKLGRNKKWLEITNKQDFIVEIIASGLTQEEAIILETKYINQYKNTLVNKLNNAKILEIPESIKYKIKFDNNSKTGLRWLKSNLEAGSLSNTGYYVVRINNVLYQAHRIVWFLTNGNIPLDYFIDHIDKNRTNNSLNNLRLITPTLNQHNKKTSNKKGIYIKPDKSVVQCYWRDPEGNRPSKSFYTVTHGFDKALELAIKYRQEQLQLINNRAGEFYVQEK